LLAKGNITVDIKWEDHKLVKLDLRSNMDQTAHVAYEGHVVSVRLEANQVTHVNMN
ncbi:MAG: glycoside hydrolase family 95-like protein, partial [Cellulosilyticaceae bacterium]